MRLQSYYIYLAWKLRGYVKYVMDAFSSNPDTPDKDELAQFCYRVLKLMGVVLSICLLAVIHSSAHIENVWLLY